MELRNHESNETEFKIDDNILKDIINAKLSSFNMEGLDNLESKTVKRLLETEFFIQYSNKYIGDKIKNIKSAVISITNLANSDIISCSRKTLYNDKVVNEYIEKCAEIETDYFNDKELKKVKDNYETLSKLHDKLLVNIIDIYDLKSKIAELNRELTNVYEEKNNLYECLVEKDKEIYELKNKLKSNNIRMFQTQK